MPYLVNGQLVPEALIAQESARIARDPHLEAISDLDVRAKRLREAAEQSAADIVLIEQLAESDPRPLDDNQTEQEIQRYVTQSGCRESFDRGELRRLAVKNLRIQRLRQEMIDNAALPTPQEVEGFFYAHRERFPKPEMFHASHIVKYVNHEQSEDQAETLIKQAEQELERGVPFPVVASQYSDCKDKDGDLGEFPAGHMVEEFEREIQALAPGERSGVFTTPFGFHIALLHSKVPAGIACFEDVRTQIERVITFAKQHEAYQRAIIKMRSRADITWAPEPSS